MLTRQQRRIARGVTAGLAVLTTSLAFGCGAVTKTDSAQPPSGPQVGSVQASSSEPAPGSAALATSDTPAPDQAPKQAGEPHQCVAADLALSLRDGDAAAGTVYRNLTFTNTSSAPCTMVGFPGVSFVTGNSGKQVGAAAYREGTKGKPVTIPVGGTAAAPVGFAQVNNFDPAQCKKTPVRGLRVYPPHDTAAMFLPAPGQGCAGDVSKYGHQLTVRTVR